MSLLGYLQRRGLVWHLAMLCTVLMVALGGTVVAIIALLSTRSTADRLSTAQTCVDEALGARNDAINRSLHAQLDFASSLKRFESVVFDPTFTRAEKAAAASQFRVDTTRWSVTTHRQLITAHRHPLGRC